jgi:hypothetical protein
MPLTLQLTEGREIRLDVDPDEWTRAFEEALQNDEVIKVTNPQGEVLAINPRQVLYWTSQEADTDRPPAEAEAALG